MFTTQKTNGWGNVKYLDEIQNTQSSIQVTLSYVLLLLVIFLHVTS